MTPGVAVYDRATGAPPAGRSHPTSTRGVPHVNTGKRARRPGGGPRAADSLAARFAAKEAFVKALGRPGVGAWHDVEVVTDGLGNPSLRLSGATADLPEVHRVAAWHMSLSHDGGIAAAVVIAEA